jgi:hypothetical protein
VTTNDKRDQHEILYILAETAGGSSDRVRSAAADIPPEVLVSPGGDGREKLDGEDSERLMIV